MVFCANYVQACTKTDVVTIDFMDLLPTLPLYIVF